MPRLVLFLICLLALPVRADSWTGPDKVQHAAVGAVIGAAIAAASKDPLVGCAAATAVGLAKEVYDHNHPQKHTASFKDFAVTAAFGCVSAYATGLVLTPYGVRYTFKF
jgi:uncharacterized protein YfiM (DUF2279 family)